MWFIIKYYDLCCFLRVGGGGMTGNGAAGFLQVEAISYFRDLEEADPD